jgi:hypothetical protein
MTTDPDEHGPGCPRARMTTDPATPPTRCAHAAPTTVHALELAAVAITSFGLVAAALVGLVLPAGLTR